MLAILWQACKWQLIVVLYYVSLISNDTQLFYMLIIHHYVFFCEEPIQIFISLFLFFVLLVVRAFKKNTSSPCKFFVRFLNVFSQSLFCLFILLMLFFWEQTFLNLMKSNINFFFFVLTSLFTIYKILPLGNLVSAISLSSCFYKMGRITHFLS